LPVKWQNLAKTGKNQAEIEQKLAKKKILFLDF